MKNIKSAFTGLLFALPFIVLNFIVSLRIEPIYSQIGQYPTIRNNPFIPLFLLLLFPIGSFIALKPILQRSKKTKSKDYMINIIVAAVMLLFFLLVFTALGQEIYKCNILNVPNCD